MAHGDATRMPTTQSAPPPGPAPRAVSTAHVALLGVLSGHAPCTDAGTEGWQWRWRGNSVVLCIAPRVDLLGVHKQHGPS